MEPFRPLIDRRVFQWIADHDPAEPLNTSAKDWMIRATTSRYLYEREERSLFDILLRAANSLSKCIIGETREISIPSLLESCSEASAPKRSVRSVGIEIALKLLDDLRIRFRKNGRIANERTASLCVSVFVAHRHVRFAGGDTGK